MSRTPPTRRAFLAGGAIAAAGAAGAAVGNAPTSGVTGGPAILRRKLSLKMVTTWPKNFPGLGTGAERVARRISEMSDGAIAIRVYAGGELVPALSAFDAVAEGKADIYHGAEYYWQGKHPGFSFFTAVPFGLTGDENNGWLLHGGGQKLWDELSARFGLKGFACGNTGVQMGGWFKRPVRSLDDFNGLRIRMPGLGGEVAKRIGATPITKSGGEIFLALSQGNIDAAEWIGPWNDLAFGFYTVAPYYYGPGFHEPGATLGLGMALNVWDNLPRVHKTIVEQATLAENNLMHAEFTLENARALRTLVDKHAVRLRQFPEDVMMAAARASGEVLAGVAAHDDLAGRIASSFFDARTMMSPWTEISEQAYTLARKQGAGAP